MTSAARDDGVPERWLVVGGSGAGKSTFSTALAERLGLPLLHLDQEYWRPGWVEPAKPEWRARVAELVAADRWVMDGNYSSTFDLRMPRAQAVVLLDIPTWKCLFSVYGRAFRYRGRTRPDLPEGCPETLPDLQFLHWILTYRRRSRWKVLEAVRQWPHLLFRSFTDRAEARRWLDEGGAERVRHEPPAATDHINR